MKRQVKVEKRLKFVSLSKQILGSQQLHIFVMFYAKLLTGLNSGEST